MTRDNFGARTAVAEVSIFTVSLTIEGVAEAGYGDAKSSSVVRAAATVRRGGPCRHWQLRFGWFHIVVTPRWSTSHEAGMSSWRRSEVARVVDAGFRCSPLAEEMSVSGPELGALGVGQSGHRRARSGQ